MSGFGAASFTVTLQTAGRAEIQAQARTVSHEIVHITQHSVSVLKKVFEAPRTASASDLGREIQDRLEARLKQQFDKS